MADRYPLIVDSSTGTVKEIPSGDNLNLSGSSIANVSGVGATNINVSGATTTSSLVVSTIDVTPIHEITNYYVTTTGSDTTGNGSLANPWRTPHKAFRELRTRRINVTDGYTRVTVNVGVGTYNFGLKQTAAGSNYIGGTYAISGGTGSGAFVAITTTTGGAISAAKLLDPGTGYLSSDTLGVSTTVGSGAVFTPFFVGDEGEILGSLSVDHIDGDQISLVGASPVGTKPGYRGNHFYNQVGVGVGSNPAGTGPNFTWSATYDSSSPAGAYPNPMVDGLGNTDASNVYNRTILEAYYQSKFYFHGCDGIVCRSSNPASFSNLLLVGQHPDGTRIQDDQEATTVGITNSIVIGISTDAGTTATEGLSRGGSFKFDNVSTHGFVYGITALGGVVSGSRFSATNSGSVGIIANGKGYVQVPYANILNHKYHACYSYGGEYYVWGGSMSNNGSIGVLNYFNGFAFVGNNIIDPDLTSIGVGQSTIIANNGAYGVHAYGAGAIRCDGVYNAKQYIYGNGSAQIRAFNGGYIEATNTAGNLVVEAAHGSTTTYSPAVNTVGNRNSIIAQ